MPFALNTRDEISLKMYRLKYNQLTYHEKDMVECEFEVQYEALNLQN